MPHNTSEPAPEYAVSVIIPALNEEKMIGKCLSAIAAMEFPRDQMEILIVDNGSKDRTIEIARAFEKTLNLRILEKKGVHISAMRNAGAAESHGSALAFLDADCIVPQNWLSNAVVLLSDPKAGVVGAHYAIPLDSTWVGRVWYEDRMAEKVGNVRYIPSGDMFLRRETFFQVGGFDESIQTNEDFELCQRVRAAGFPVKSYPDLRVVHLGTPRTLQAFYRKQRWHGTHVLTVFLRNIRKGSNIRSVLFSLYMLLWLVGIFLGAIFGVVGWGWKICWFSIAMFLIPSLLIASKRVASRGKWTDVLPAAFLYLTFGVARVASILDYKTWSSFRRNKGSENSSNRTATSPNKAA